MSRARLFWWGQLILTGAFALLLLYVVPLERFAASLLSADAGPTLAAGALVMGLVVCDTARISALLRLETRLRIANRRIGFAAAAIAQLPLGFVGADAYRIAALGALGIPAARAFSATLFSRIAGLAALLFAGAVGAFAYALQAQSDLAPLLLGAVFLAGSAGLTALLVLPPHTFRRLAGRLPVKRLRTRIDSLDTALAPVKGEVALWSLLMAVFRAGLISVCAAALGVSVGLDLAALTAALAFLTLFVPISFAGFGLREGGIALILSLAGVETGTALILAVFYRAMLIAGALAGLAVSALHETVAVRSAR